MGVGSQYVCDNYKRHLRDNRYHSTVDNVMDALETATWNTFNAVGQLERPLLVHRLCELLDRSTVAEVNRFRVVDNIQTTLLNCAVQRTDVEVVSTLLSHGANPNISCGSFPNERRTSLFTCCLHSKNNPKQMIIAEMLIKYGVDISARTAHIGTTVLHVACSCANVEFVKMLLHNKADMNAVDIRGANALTYVARNNHGNPANLLSIIKILWQHGADIHAVDMNGRTLLHHIAVSDPPWNMHIVHFLVNHGVQDLEDNNGVTAGELARTAAPSGGTRAYLSERSGRFNDPRYEKCQSNMFGERLQGMFDDLNLRRVAFAMSQHTRLGEHSSVGDLPSELMKKISGYVEDRSDWFQ
jgi:ankyrin repeat protein